MSKRIDVPQEKRQEIFHELISLSKENILPRGALVRVAKKHDFSRQTIKRIWENGPNKRSKSGRKVKWTDDLVKSPIKEVPWENRTSLRSLAYASAIPAAILTRKIQKGLLFSSYIDLAKKTYYHLDGEVPP